jgi:hypothetical protein
VRSISKFKKKLKAMAQSSWKIIGLFKYSHLVLCLNILMLLVTSQQIMFSNYLAPASNKIRTYLHFTPIHPSVTYRFHHHPQLHGLDHIHLNCTLKFCFEFITTQSQSHFHWRTYLLAFRLQQTPRSTGLLCHQRHSLRLRLA